MDSLNRYLIVDPVGGTAGDMWLAALVDLGVPWDDLVEALSALPISGYKMDYEQVTVQGINCSRVKVYLDEEPQPHRHLHHIVKIIEESTLDGKVKEQSIAVFTRLAEAEAKVHGTTIEKVHFHEVGAVDAIVDIVGTVWALHKLEIDEVYCLPLPLGSGTVRCAHGLMPVPAPATAELVKNFPVRIGVGEGELVTPTGAALCTTLGKPLEPQESTSWLIEKNGYGAGLRPSKSRPNLMRLMLAKKKSL
ncbi:LarC family nickel insertion protein [Heliorestis acidaminivorans]|uniref:LarC family nickel insertion protein n=1 Tax=Heliorestis acidaminivorans TaxID=553427 RepID=A0A6I0EUN7_9FIRM|nr:LarC family nickel insertion protein [Heliorestis acidaminivorans]KAB2953914.1 LarC family nickel insertion protein [Heliorestis acidaminivorans]